jgi:hypothetical protein
MAKPNFQEILLQKGDKIALAAGGVLALLLAVLGIVSFAGAESPSGTVTKFKSATDNVSRGLKSEGESAPELPIWVNKSSTSKAMPMDAFALIGKPFEPIHQPDTRRTNPQVMPVVSSQVDLIRGPMRALDIYIDGAGAERVVRMGVLKEKSKAGTENLASKAMTDAALKRLNAGSRAQSKTGTINRPRPGMGGPGGAPGMGGPGMGGPGGGAPGMGGAGMGGPGGGAPGMGGPGGGSGFGGGEGGSEGGGGFAGGMPGMPGMGGGTGGGFASAARSDLAVEYATPEDVQSKGLQLAETVYPLRGVLIHAAFPLKEQLEEIRRSLRARDIYEAISLSSAVVDGVAMTGPVFRGFEVERRRIGRDGTPTEWSVFDHENEYFREISTRVWANAPDAGEIGYFMKQGDQSYRQRLMAPLPALADNLAEYPRLRMKPIQDTITKLKEQGKQPPTLTEWQRRFSGNLGDSNPYAPVGQSGAGNTGAGAGGLGSEAGGPGGGSRPGMPGMPGGPGMVGPGGPGMAGPGMPGVGGPGVGGPQPPRLGAPGNPAGGTPGLGNLMNANQAQLDSDYLLLRFLDTTVKEGESYQYRIRVKLHNPNFGKKGLTTRNEEAETEILYGPWAMVSDTATVPAESFFYAYKSADYLTKVTKLVEEHGKELAIRNYTEEKAVNEGRRAVVQVQDWMQQVRIDGTEKREPVGTWVVAEIPVMPGYPIARRALVELPLWSAGLNNYVLRDVSGGTKIFGIKDPKHQPKGWPVPFNTGSLLIDFEGGNFKTRINDKEVLDEAETELLILRSDGKVQVRSSATDMADTQRVANNNRWNSWLDIVRQRKDSAAATGSAGAPGGFGRQPGGPGGGSPGGGSPGGGGR